MTYDLIIVGGAPAGLTAALFAARRGLKTLLLTKNIGGQIATTSEVENYPGLKFIAGYELGEVMAEQATRAGTEIKLDTVELIEQSKEPAATFNIKTTTGLFTTKSVILALGKAPRSLNVPGEQEFLGKGVSYCAGCDIKKYAGQPIVIVGGGSSAFTAAKLAITHSEQVWLVHRNGNFRAEQVLIDKVLSSAKVKVKTDAEVTKIEGNEKGVSQVTIQTTKGPESIPAKAVFIEIGFEVKSGFLKELVKMNELNQVIINERQETSVPGVFAAGDITNTPFNQAVISAGEGAKAALAAFSFLNGNRPISADWGKN